MEFSSSLPMLLYKALDEVMPDYRTLFSEHGLTEQQWRVLRVLWDKAHLTPKEIATETLLPAPSLVGILDRLEKKGLVTRLRSTSDRRQVHVKPTAAAIMLQRQVMPKVAKINAANIDRLGEDDWAHLLRILKKVQSKSITKQQAS